VSAVGQSPNLDELLLDPQFPADPYPVYRRLHAEAPVFWSPQLGYWFVTGYEDIKQILKTPKQFASGGWDEIYMLQLPARGEGVDNTTQLDALGAHFSFPNLVSADPPEHTRLRRLVHRAFTPAAVELIRAHIEETVEALVGRARERGEFEVLRDLAIPLPISVFAFMFGMPESEHNLLKRTSADFTRFVSSVRPNWADAELSNESLREFRLRLLELFRSRRSAPEGDLVSVLVSTDSDGDRLSDDELLSLCAHLLIAGHETTTNLIASGVLALLQHPEQRALLEANSKSIPSAIEEIARWETPLQRVKRIATTATQVGSTEIASGDRLMLLVGAANRDPTVFDRPDAFDVTIERRPHMAFGHGIHFCVGAALARLEARVAIEAMLDELPNMAFQPGWKPRWNPSLLRGLADFPVSIA
jgi:cytochrome P450